MSKRERDEERAATSIEMSSKCAVDFNSALLADDRCAERARPRRTAAVDTRHERGQSTPHVDGNGLSIAAQETERRRLCGRERPLQPLHFVAS